MTPTRFVALDTETTGLDARRDRIITIGAVAVIDGEIRLDDCFEVLLPIAYNNSSVTVHGITRDESQSGTDEEVALAEFVRWLGDAVIVGHHIGHDITALSFATERHFGAPLTNRSVDTMDLTLHLEQTGIFGDLAVPPGFTLDSLCDMFGVIAHDRHTAGGDAFITAQVFLRLLKYAHRAGLDSLDDLCKPFHQ